YRLYRGNPRGARRQGLGGAILRTRPLPASSRVSAGRAGGGAYRPDSWARPDRHRRRAARRRIYQRRAEQIQRAAADNEVRAIVFRVNSPGGSAVGSDLVWRAVREARKRGKPV